MGRLWRLQHYGLRGRAFFPTFSALLGRKLLATWLPFNVTIFYNIQWGILIECSPLSETIIKNGAKFKNVSKATWLQFNVTISDNIQWGILIECSPLSETIIKKWRQIRKCKQKNGAKCKKWKQSLVVEMMIF